MAVQIPIWPGSASFCETPFGYYDTESQFQLDAEIAAVWAGYRLGYPIVDVELQGIHFFAAFEEAVTEYAYMVNAYNLRDNMLALQGAPTSSNLTQRLITDNLGRVITISKEYGGESRSGGTTEYKTGSIEVLQGQQDYDLNAWADMYVSESIEIKKIHHYAPPAIVRYFDPFVGTGMGAQQMLDAFGWGNYSPGVQFMLMPVYADILRLQAIEFNDQVRRSNFSFELVNNRLRLFPIPQSNTTLYFDYILMSERSDPLKTDPGVISDFSNARYDLIPYRYINTIGKRWILRYYLAICKEILGQIRSKYSSIPIPNAEATLNGPSLISESQQEKNDLIAELKEHLEYVSKTAMLDRKRQEAESLNNVVNKIPLPFKIG